MDTKKWKKKTRKSFRSTIQSVRILDQPIPSSKFPPGHLGTLNEFEPICLNTMVGVSLWCARCLLFAEEAISQASPQSATNPKLAHPPLRNYGKPLHPRFSRSLQKTIRYFVRYFALDFFVKQAPAPLYWQSAFWWYRNESRLCTKYQMGLTTHSLSLLFTA